MKATDQTKLIEGLLVVILAAIAIGQLGDLHHFATREAARSLRGWDTHAFFPTQYRKLLGRTQDPRVHLKGARGSHPLSNPNQLKYRSQDLNSQM